MYILLFLLCGHMLFSMVTLLTFMWLFWSIHYTEYWNIEWIWCYLTFVTSTNKLWWYSALISSEFWVLGHICANLRLYKNTGLVFKEHCAESDISWWFLNNLSEILNLFEQGPASLQRETLHDVNLENREKFFLNSNQCKH